MDWLGLQLKMPVWQAPMAGITTPALVAEACNAGALGNIGAGYLTGEHTRRFIREVKSLTDKPFGINLFIPSNAEASSEEFEAANRLLEPFRQELGLNEPASVTAPAEYDDQLAVVLEEKVKLCSFTFGLPDEKTIQLLKENGTIVVGTATTVQEAIAAEATGMDAVVVQGTEAGGHRGSFLENESYIGLFSLLPQAVQAVTIPVIAAGGIMNGQGIAAALCLGAKAVQMGTAFLVADESAAHALHKEGILHASEEDVQLTKAFSGKTARGVANEFIKKMRDKESSVLPYPLQHVLTAEIRKKAALENNSEYLSMWSGQSPRLSRSIPIEGLMKKLEEEMISAAKNLIKY